MAKAIWNELSSNVWWWILTVLSVTLLFAGLFLPPMGIIDSSVLVGVGEILGLGALKCVYEAIIRGIDTTIQHNNTSITLNNPDNKDADNA